MTKAEERKLKEQLRLQSMTSFERPFWENGILVAGMDEVGRGPLAGPVVAACVVMRNEPLIEGVNDSKKVSEHKRERLYDEIRENALAFGFGWEFQDVIDEINILEATKIKKEINSELRNLRFINRCVAYAIECSSTKGNFNWSELTLVPRSKEKYFQTAEVAGIGKMYELKRTVYKKKF